MIDPHDVFEAESLDQFIINRGYSLKSLQLIALLYRRKSIAERKKNIKVIINYRQKALIFKTYMVSEFHNIHSICTTSIKYNKEILLIMAKSLPNTQFIQCFLLRLQLHSDALCIISFVSAQSRNTNTFPNYSTTFFERDTVLHNPLSSIMHNHEVDEVQVLSATKIPLEESENINFFKTLMDCGKTDSPGDGNGNYKLFDINTFTNNPPGSKIVEYEKCFFQSLTKSCRVFLSIITTVSIQFIDTQTKSITVEIYYVDIKLMIRQTEQLKKVLLIIRNHISDSEHCLESLYIQFPDVSNSKKFVDILCNKGELQSRGLRLCSRCPMNVINGFSQELSEETNDFQFEDPGNLEKLFSASRLKSLINFYSDKIEESQIKKMGNESLAEQIISLFEGLLKFYEKHQAAHKCSLQTKGKILRKGSSRVWENVKNLFGKKFSLEEKIDDAIDAFQIVLKNEEGIKEDIPFPVTDNDGSILRSVTSRTRRIISVSESALQKPSFLSLNSEDITETNYLSIEPNQKRRKTFNFMNLLRATSPVKVNWKSFCLVVIACQKFMKSVNLQWTYDFHNKGKIDEYPINLIDIKSSFGPDEKFSYSLNTISNNSFATINSEWDIILKNNGKRSLYSNKLWTDGISLNQRRDVWILLMNSSPCISKEKIYKYDLNPKFQTILQQMLFKNIFECDLVREFYKQSFMYLDRCNTDILNDVGRTMPQLSYFGIQISGQLALYNVLRAYSSLDFGVTYCQGLNFIVSIFLLYMDEEEAFISLIFYMIFLERREIYLPSMIGIKHSFYKLERLVLDFCPALNHHLFEKEFPISLYASSWIMTIFSTSYPLHFVTRVLDMVISEGPSIIYNISITLISYVADKIIQLNEFDLIYELFNKHLNTLSDDELTQILHKASENHINSNLKIYELEILCNIKNNDMYNEEFIRKICSENEGLRLESAILRKKNEDMQKEIIRLKRLIKHTNESEIL